MEANQQKVKQAFNGAGRAVADEIKSGASQLAGQAVEKFGDMEETMGTRYRAIKESAADGYETAINTVKKYPLYAILGATGIGLLGGMLLARRGKH